MSGILTRRFHTLNTTAAILTAALMQVANAQESPPESGPEVAPPPAAPAAAPLIDQYVPPMRTLTLNRTVERPSLPVPEGDFPGQALSESVPAWYITPPWYAVCRPNRTLHPFRHQPLYFEDAAAERCGESCGFLQPAVSVTRFTTDLLLLPCRMYHDGPCSSVPAGRDCPVPGPARRPVNRATVHKGHTAASNAPRPIPEPADAGFRTVSAVVKQPLPTLPAPQPVAPDGEAAAKPRLEADQPGVEGEPASLSGPVTPSSALPPAAAPETESSANPVETPAQNSADAAPSQIPSIDLDEAAAAFSEPPGFARHPSAPAVKKGN